MTTSVALSPVAILQFFDNTGKPCVGGSLLTQSGGVNYATYSEPTGTTALPNPIPLNSRGEVSTAAGASSELFLQTGVAYTFTLKDKDGNQLWSVGNITTGSGNTAVSFPTASGSANAQVVTNPVPISLGNGVIQWFLPVSANTGATTLNVDNSGAKNVFFLTKALSGGELQIGVPAEVIYDGTQWNLNQSAKGPAGEYYLDTGAVNAMVITANMAQSAYADGMRFKIKVANTNTASTPTLNVNGFGAKNIYYADTATGLVAGANSINGIYTYTYDSSLNSSAGGFICSDASRAAGSFTITLKENAGATTVASGTLNYSVEPSGKKSGIWAVSTISGASAHNDMTGTGIPTIIQTGTSKLYSLALINSSGISQIGPNVVTGTGGTWTFGNPTAANFTASGNKGITAGAGWSMDLD